MERHGLSRPSASVAPRTVGRLSPMAFLVPAAIRCGAAICCRPFWSSYQKALHSNRTRARRTGERRTSEHSMVLVRPLTRQRLHDRIRV